MKKNASAAVAANKKNSSALVISKEKKTETQKAAERAQKALEREAAKEGKKCALSYGMYSLLKEANNTPSRATKNFYDTALSVAGGAFEPIFREILGANKNDFCAEYAPRVKKAFEEKERKNYTLFLVWGVVWADLKELTNAKIAAVDPTTAKAVLALKAAFEELKAAKAEE